LWKYYLFGVSFEGHQTVKKKPHVICSSKVGKYSLFLRNTLFLNLLQRAVTGEGDEQITCTDWWKKVFRITKIFNKREDSVRQDSIEDHLISLLLFFFTIYKQLYNLDQEMYPEEKAEDDETKVIIQPLFNGSDSDGDISASADDATEEEWDGFGNENLDSF
jgi:hypothetical protein